MQIIDFNLPEKLIAKRPVSPRDSSRLFVFDTKKNTINFDIFRNIYKYLPSKSLLAFNDTKVVPARLLLEKDTGGRVEILLLLNEVYKNEIRCIADRQLKVGGNLHYRDQKLFEVTNQIDQFFYLRPLFDKKKILDIINKIGETPLPPYMGKNPITESEARVKYQTVFAQKNGSIAAPTASLHFTNRLINKLKNNGVLSANVTLHVGMGTFSPIDESNFESKSLHTEVYEISKQNLSKIMKAKKDGYKIVPVGTTATRVLESIAKNNLSKISGETNLFIFDPFVFKFTDSLITNFHTPKSSLILLIDAFLKHKNAKKSVLDLYKIAIDNDFRFYSFGDSMLII